MDELLEHSFSRLEAIDNEMASLIQQAKQVKVLMIKYEKADTPEGKTHYGKRLKAWITS